MVHSKEGNIIRINGNYRSVVKEEILEDDDSYSSSGRQTAETRDRHPPPTCQDALHSLTTGMYHAPSSLFPSIIAGESQ